MRPWSWSVRRRMPSRNVCLPARTRKLLTLDDSRLSLLGSRLVGGWRYMAIIL
jgi:hypothetical protein